MRQLTDHIVEGDSANHQVSITVTDEPGAAERTLNEMRLSEKEIAYLSSPGRYELTMLVDAHDREHEAKRKLAHYDWRPISEIHEDFGPCVLMNINDPGYQEVGSNLNTDYDESKWTHFAEVPKLTSKRAQELIEAMG